MRHKDGSMVIEGRTIGGQHPLDGTGHAEYRKTKTVLAKEAPEPGLIYTPEGAMGFEAGDFIVTDIPPTHAWPVRREVFLDTHERVGDPVDEATDEAEKEWAKPLPKTL